jgi:hypothetical protein
VPCAAMHASFLRLPAIATDWHPNQSSSPLSAVSIIFSLFFFVHTTARDAESFLAKASTHFIRLVSVVVGLYLNFDHVMLVFSLHLDHQRSSSNLQHLVHSQISISYISLLSFSQHHYFRIHFVENEFEKTN